MGLRTFLVLDISSGSVRVGNGLKSVFGRFDHRSAALACLGWQVLSVLL